VGRDPVKSGVARSRSKFGIGQSVGRGRRRGMRGGGTGGVGGYLLEGRRKKTTMQMWWKKNVERG